MQRSGFANAFVRRARMRYLLAAMLLWSMVWARSAFGESTTVLAYGVEAVTSFDIMRNGVPVTSGASTALGSLAFAMETNSGTLVAIAPLGDLAPPAPPVFTSLEATDPGCAVAAWTPSGDPTVVGYVVDYGTQSVGGGEASEYEHSMEVGATGSASVCFLPLGTNYVAVRAKNLAGMLSAHSEERSVLIMHVSVLISRFDARAQPDGVRLEWKIEADEIVRGFRVYRSAAGELQKVLTDLPADATGFVDTEAEPGVAYTYVLAAVKESGEEVRSIPVVVAMEPISFELEPNFPNPFNPQTRIGFALAQPGRAVLAIFDVRGARVTTLVDTHLRPGRYSIDWHGTDAAGLRVASGTYFCLLAASKKRQSRKLVLLK
jgi:hypothetical protein